MIDEIAISGRAQHALSALRSNRPGASVVAEQVLTHDITSLISEIRYLRRQIAATRLETSAFPTNNDHPRFSHG